MKVAILAEQLRQEVPGGIGTYTRGLLWGLHGMGPDSPETEVWASRGPSPDPLTTYAHSVGARLHATAWPHRLQMLLWDRRVGSVGEHGSVVHRTSLAGPSTAEGPSSVMIHDLAWRAEPSLTTARGAKWHEAALGRAIASPSALIVPSSQVADALGAQGVHPSRIHVIPEGADHLGAPDEVSASAVLNAAGVNGPFLLSVSTLEPRKNLAGLVAAYQAAGIAVPLVVVGPRGWGPELAPAPGVVLLGALPPGVLAGLYGRCTGFCYVPHLEGFGLPPLEAAHFGAPMVVSTAVPSTAALEGNFKVDATDTAGIAAALRAMVTGGDDITTARESARAFADRHRWADVARRHVAVWETLR